MLTIEHDWSLKSHRRSLSIPLNKEYLLRGIPVVELYGRQFLFLWDTGSIENIMSEFSYRAKPC